jgi:hypothetical protein
MAVAVWTPPKLPRRVRGEHPPRRRHRGLPAVAWRRLPAGSGRGTCDRHCSPLARGRPPSIEPARRPRASGKSRAPSHYAMTGNPETATTGRELADIADRATVHPIGQVEYLSDGEHGAFSRRSPPARRCRGCHAAADGRPGRNARQRAFAADETTSRIGRCFLDHGRGPCRRPGLPLRTFTHGAAGNYAPSHALT